MKKTNERLISKTLRLSEAVNYFQTGDRVKIPIPLAEYKFEPTDGSELICILITRDGDSRHVLRDIYVNVVHSEVLRGTRFILGLEIPKNSLQQFKECCK